MPPETQTTTLSPSDTSSSRDTRSFSVSRLRRFVASHPRPPSSSALRLTVTSNFFSPQNMGLYSERVGAFSVVTASPEERDRVDSQLKILVRPLYSNPPIHGARIASIILGNPELNKEWLGEVKGQSTSFSRGFGRHRKGGELTASSGSPGMADRIISMRDALYDGLMQRNTPGEWNHSTSCFLLLPPPIPR